MRRSDLEEGLLFHSTTAPLAITILRVGGIAPGGNGFISFTSDPNLWFGNDEIGGGKTQFVFDRLVLEKFGLEEYDCAAGSEDAFIESEERIRLARHRLIDIRLASEIWTRDNIMVSTLEREAKKWVLPVRKIT
jgi:hypothetical protein